MKLTSKLEIFRSDASHLKIMNDDNNYVASFLSMNAYEYNIKELVEKHKKDNRKILSCNTSVTY